MTQTAPKDNADGRVRRGLRNRQQVVDAMVALVREGNLRPTAEQIAERAGVGTRTVFRHFEDMESLLLAVGYSISRELRPMTFKPAMRGTLRDRAHDVARMRGQTFDHLAPFERAAAVSRWRSPFLIKLHEDAVRKLREDLGLRLAPEIFEIDDDTLEAIDVLTSFECWDRMRTVQRLEFDDAVLVLEKTILDLLRSGARKTKIRSAQ